MYDWRLRYLYIYIIICTYTRDNLDVCMYMYIYMIWLKYILCICADLGILSSCIYFNVRYYFCCFYRETQWNVMNFYDHSSHTAPVVVSTFHTAVLLQHRYNINSAMMFVCKIFLLSDVCRQSSVFTIFVFWHKRRFHCLLVW